jgi:hypothetical protein
MRFCSGVWVLAGLCLFTITSGDGQEAKSNSVHETIGIVDANGYSFPWDNGLYATISVGKAFGDPNLENEKSVNLKEIPGFEKDLKTRIQWQEQHTAPLVIRFPRALVRFNFPR